MSLSIRNCLDISDRASARQGISVHPFLLLESDESNFFSGGGIRSVSEVTIGFWQVALSSRDHYWTEEWAGLVLKEPSPAFPLLKHAYHSSRESWKLCLKLDVWEAVSFSLGPQRSNLGDRASCFPCFSHDCGGVAVGSVFMGTVWRSLLGCLRRKGKKKDLA